MGLEEFCGFIALLAFSKKSVALLFVSQAFPNKSGPVAVEELFRSKDLAPEVDEGVKLFVSAANVGVNKGSQPKASITVLPLLN